MTPRWTTEKFAVAPLKIIDGDRGKNYPKHPDFHDTGHCLFLNTGNVTQHGFNFDQCQFITEDKDDALRKGKLLRGDVVLTTRGTVGNVAHYGDAIPFKRVRINSGMVIFRTQDDKLLPRFLYHYLRSNIFKRQVNSLRTGAAQPQLPIRDIRAIGIPVPTISTQHRIADILSAYDDLIENNRRRIALLERAARELYREWFACLRFPGHEHTKIVDGVPEGWERKKISDACNTTGGGTPSTKVASYWGGDVTWVVPTDVTKNDCLVLLDSARKITEEGLRESSAKMVPAETILMTSRASVGFFALIDREVCTNQGFINVIPRDEEMRQYLLFNLMSRVAEIRSNAKGSTYPEISKGRFRDMDIVVPAKPLVVEFANIAATIIRQVRCLKRLTLGLCQARDLLLPRMMSRELAV